MLDFIKEIHAQQTFLSPIDLFKLASISKLERIKKGQHLVRSGDINYKVILVYKGLLRHYIIDKEEKKKPFFLYLKKEIVQAWKL